MYDRAWCEECQDFTPLERLSFADEDVAEVWCPDCGTAWLEEEDYDYI